MVYLCAKNASETHHIDDPQNTPSAIRSALNAVNGAVEILIMLKKAKNINIIAGFESTIKSVEKKACRALIFFARFAGVSGSLMIIEIPRMHNAILPTILKYCSYSCIVGPINVKLAAAMSE